MNYPIGVTCQELVELVTEYIEGALPYEARARFEEHLSACPGCEDYVEQMRQTIRATGRLTEESLDAATREQLMAVFSEWTRHGSIARGTQDAC
jgi:anti-sigma factor RsiW